MFASQNKSVIFMEMAYSLKPHNHTFIECIPMDPGLASDAPMYFKVIF